MGFNIPFHIIFGTNLLTEARCKFLFFCLFQCFTEKEYQMKSKRNETFGRVIFGTNVIQETWSGCQERSKEATRQEGAPRGVGAPPTLMGPSQLHRRTSSSYIYTYTLKTSRSTRNPISTAATFCTSEIPSCGLFQRSAGGGINHRGLLHQHHSLFDEV